MTTINCWIDCDPGHDDAIMVLMATILPQFNVLGISASYGNAGPIKTLKNLTSILKMLNKYNDIPVFKGAQEPLVSDHTDSYSAPEIHGESGLDGTKLLPEPNLSKVSTDCNEFIKFFEKKCLEYKDGIVFISTGSLTSLAQIIMSKPHLKDSIKYVTVMGGSFEETGNRNENLSAEFNIFIDSCAANCCFQDPILKNKILLFPLDITHKALATEKICQQIWNPEMSDSKKKEQNVKVRRMYYELLQFFKKHYINNQSKKFVNGPPVHDPLVLMPLFPLFGWSDEVKDCGLKYKRRELMVVEDPESPDLGKIIVTKEYPSDEKLEQGVKVFYDMKMDFFWGKVFEAFDILDDRAKTDSKNE